jgi:Fe-S-cluster-containing hydrogenase component 2
VAVKCDLCEGYDDYACVRACPVGAAMRIDPVLEFKREDLNIGVEMKNLKDVV